MGLWGALEAAIDDICTARVMNHPRILTQGVFLKMKVSVGLLLGLPPRARARFLPDEAKRSHGADFKIGVGQFEAQLGEVGLDGDLDSHVRNVIRIAKASRNVIAHRAGKVDSRFVEVCPDLGLREGDAVRINASQMLAIVGAMHIYVETINLRAVGAEGRSAREIELPPWIQTTAELMDPFRLEELTS